MNYKNSLVAMLSVFFCFGCSRNVETDGTVYLPVEGRKLVLHGKDGDLVINNAAHVKASIRGRLLTIRLLKPVNPNAVEKLPSEIQIDLPASVDWKMGANFKASDIKQDFDIQIYKVPYEAGPSYILKEVDDRTNWSRVQPRSEELRIDFMGRGHFSGSLRFYEESEPIAPIRSR